ncbi:hypothetical protein PACTADRAFT_50429 [Pachysolen tannophilus NRRL Y-2460]|uniref:Small ribosomal subunit protein mS41 n=1 Tax=Pachysolen tannophilus NRRL Y-2460 TaxID=669874 RepID=A0A1E4TS34_PACTA|nr:hypothetical protein PACTADRAFT_50429 [Pachysolen tannophilus NRRL Y-2460]
MGSTASTAPTRLMGPTRYIRSYTQLIDGSKIEKIPKPTSTVPDVKTFLAKIGRNAEEHVEIFENWDQLFTLSSKQLKEKGVADARLRKYLLSWREKFRKGEPLRYIARGTKKNGGERKRRAFLANKRFEETIKQRELKEKWLKEHGEA